MKNKIFDFLDLMVLFMLILTPFAVLTKLTEIEYKLNHPIVYQTDNAGSMTAVGIVTEKKSENGEYSIAVNGYGWFLVSKEHFEMVQVSKKAPAFITERGS